MGMSKKNRTRFLRKKYVLRSPSDGTERIGVKVTSQMRAFHKLEKSAFFYVLSIKCFVHNT